MPFDAQRLDAIPDAVLIEPTRFEDSRGAFMEVYRASEFTQLDLPTEFPQDNESFTAERGTIRGLHYQLHPHTQGHLVRCVRGSIFDVGVDIRQGSPTYGNWVGVELSHDDHRMLWLPPGLAHGMATLEPNCEVFYKMAYNEYEPNSDRAIHFDDAEIGIEWPIEDPIINERDAKAPPLADVDNNIVWDKR